MPTAAPRPPRIAHELDRVEGLVLEDDLAVDDAELRSIDVDGRVARVQVTGSVLDGVDLVGSDVEHLSLTDVIVRDADLSGAMLLEADLGRVTFERCRMSGVVLAGATLRDVRFSGCRMDGAVLDAVRAERTEAVDCVLAGADLQRLAADGTRWLDCDLHEADVRGASLVGAALHGSRLDGLLGATALAGALLSDEQLVPAGLAVLTALGVALGPEGDPRR